MNNMTLTGMQSDHYFTGKLYPKLDSYIVYTKGEYKGKIGYVGSSNSFKTQRSYKRWLFERHVFCEDVKLVIKKA